MPLVPAYIQWKLLLATGILLHLCLPGIDFANAQTGSGPETKSYEPVKGSAFELIFNQHYPDIYCKDAPRMLKEMGITCRYSIIEMRTRYNKRWRFAGKGFERRLPKEQLITPPTIADGRELLALSGLNMMDILDYKALIAAGDRDGLFALLARYIDPKMDKYNRMAVDGYDPEMCINATRDHVYSLDIESGTLNDIRKSAKLFHTGRYEEYRVKLQEYLPEYPNLSYLHVGIGNSYFAEGDLVRAQQWYRKGASANPLNPMLGYSMAFCYLANGDGPKAIEALTGSVVTCRNNLLAWVALECLLSDEGGRVIDRRFRDRTYARGTHIWVDKGVQPRLVESWLYYAAADIVINNKRTELQTVFDTWDIEEFEFYKVAHLLGMYIFQKQEVGAASDPYLEALVAIYQAGYLRQYVLYDKIAPFTRYHLTSTMSEKEKQELRDYIDRFVIRR